MEEPTKPAPIILVPICNDKRCQTIGYIGDNKTLLPLINTGLKGIDRVVPVGKTMDFDLIWESITDSIIFILSFVRSNLLSPDLRPLPAVIIIRSQSAQSE